MKTYTLTFAQAVDHVPAHPDRTARRNNRGMNFDVTFQVWNSRAALRTTINMQEQRAPDSLDWKPVIKFSY